MRVSLISIILVVTLCKLLGRITATIFEFESNKLLGNSGFCDDVGSQAPCALPFNANLTLSKTGLEEFVILIARVLPSFELVFLVSFFTGSMP